MKFAFFSEKFNIGFNSHRQCYMIKDGEDFNLPPKVIRGLLYFVLPDKKVISYNKLKKNFSHKNYICELNPLPF
jgi:hypothetical protein